MSKKIDSRALRVGVSQDYRSSYFMQGKSYAEAVVEDDKIRTALGKLLRGAGLEVILIERSIKTLKITIKVSKPGVVIGRKGAGLGQLRAKIESISKARDIDLQIEEVKKPEMSAPVIAENIALQIEKRVHVKRAINSAAEGAMGAGAKGVKIQVGGVINGPNSIALVDIVSKGAVPTQTLRADIDYSTASASTRGGLIGVKVWVNKGEIDL